MELRFPKNGYCPLMNLLHVTIKGDARSALIFEAYATIFIEQRSGFVQRHPPDVVIPSSTLKRFSLFFSATFGFLPESGPLGDVANIYLKALDGKRIAIKPVEFPRFLDRKYLYPLRATHHKLDTFRNSWSIDSKLFYMDETSSFDLIEF